MHELRTLEKNIRKNMKYKFEKEKGRKKVKKNLLKEKNLLKLQSL